MRPFSGACVKRPDLSSGPSFCTDLAARHLYAARFDLFSRNFPGQETRLTKPTRSLTMKPQKNPAAVALGKLGGLKGGKARAAKLSAKRRKEIAQKAAVARWRK